MNVNFAEAGETQSRLKRLEEPVSCASFGLFSLLIILPFSRQEVRILTQFDFL
jgi:hypothetical protein